MFVYVVKDAKKPQFKIGKAKVVLNRLAKLGNLEDFDLAGSYCLRLPTEADAFRIEAAIQKLFHPFNVEPDANNRRLGDTEIFRLECFGHVINFLRANPDLFFGAVPEAISEPVESANAPRKVPEQLLRERQERATDQRAVAELKFDISMVVFDGVVSQLTDLRPEVFDLSECPNPRGEQPKQVVHIESSDREIFDRAHGLVCTLQYLRFSSRLDGMDRSNLAGNVLAHWDDAQRRGRLSVQIVVPVTPDNRHELNQEYVDIHDMIPRSQAPRKPLDLDIASWLKVGDGYLPLTP